MKVRFIRWYQTILTALLTLMGFEACGSNEEDDTIRLMYGVPNAAYHLSGTVTDQDGNPVEDIKAAVKMAYMIDAKNQAIVYDGIDSVKTDANGQYKLAFSGFPNNPGIKVIVEDIDGPANGGEFQSDTLDIDYDKAVMTEEGKSTWNSGTFAIRQDIKMKKKE